MPSIKAANLKPGHVLVDPDGHLYEVQGIRMETLVYAWLWRDNENAPGYFQEFSPGEEINIIGETVIYGPDDFTLRPGKPDVAVNDEPDKGGAAE